VNESVCTATELQVNRQLRLLMVRPSEVAGSMISISSSHRFTGLFISAALNQSMSGRGNRKRLESKELRTGLLEHVRMGKCEQTIGRDVIGQVLEPLNGSDVGRGLNIEEPAQGPGAAHQSAAGSVPGAA
jgi:hypothetical protein